MGQYHFDPETYLAMMTAELPRYEEMQDRTAAATDVAEVGTILELGTGTGETARRVLECHPDARLVGVDASAAMLAVARDRLDSDRVELRVGRLEDPLPGGPYDLVLSALCVHHLDGPGKRDLFRRIRAVLPAGGRFVLADVVVPVDPDDAVTPLSPRYDLPDSLADQLEWLSDAGFEAHAVWSWKDVVVVVADGRPVQPTMTGDSLRFDLPGEVDSEIDLAFTGRRGTALPPGSAGGRPSTRDAPISCVDSLPPSR